MNLGKSTYYNQLNPTMLWLLTQKITLKGDISEILQE